MNGLRLVVAALAVLISGWLWSAPVAHAASTATAEWQADAAHSGFVYGAGVVPPLRKAWTADLGGQNYYVVIDGGRMFATTTARSSSGPWSTWVEAIDLNTGAVEWRHEIGTYGTGYLIVDGGRLFSLMEVIDQAQNTTDLVLSALDETTGAVLWQMNPPGQWSPSPPVARNGTLYFDGEGWGGTVYAVRESDGQLLWSTDLLAGNSVTLAGDTVVDAGTCGLTYGLDSSTGAVRWQDSDNCDGGGLLMSTFDGTDVWGERYQGSLGQLYASSDGSIPATFDGYAPAFGYGEAVQMIMSDSSRNRGPAILRAFDPSSRTVRWAFTEPSGTGPAFVSDPLLADGYVFAEDGPGDVWAFSPCTGAVAWQATVSPTTWTFVPEPVPTLAAGDGYLIVPSTNGVTAFKGSGSPTAPSPSCGDDNPPSGGGQTQPSPNGGGPSQPPPSGNGPATGNPSAPSSQGSPSSSAAPAVIALPPAKVVSPVTRPPRLLEAIGLRCGRSRCALRLRAQDGGHLVAQLMNGRRLIALGSGRVRRGTATVMLQLRRAHAPGQYRLVLSLRRSHQPVMTLVQLIRIG